MARTLDLACLLVAFVAAGRFATLLASRGSFKWPPASATDLCSWPAHYIVMFLTSVIAWIAASGYRRVYRHEMADLPLAQLKLLLRAELLWMAGTAVGVFLLKANGVSRVFTLAYLMTAAVLVAGRQGAELALSTRSNRRRHSKPTLVIGSGAEAEMLSGLLVGDRNPQRRVLRLDPADYLRVSLEDADVISRIGLDSPEVFVIGAEGAYLLPRLLQRGIAAHLVPALFDASIFHLALETIEGIPLITVETGTLSAAQAALKRIFDFVGAIFLMAALAPVFALTTLLVKLSSPGPVFFRQERLGKGGKAFKLYKFRTMRRDAEELLKADRELYRKYVENNYKLPKGEDQRVTRVGELLRQLSIDEIPQLINVVRGEMSLVGPRPIVPAELDNYGDYAALLLSVQPGVTGYWQVSGRSNVRDYSSRVRMDMEYIRDQSLTEDLRILAKTVPAVLLKEGAH